jgi:putative flippase GtrA
MADSENGRRRLVTASAMDIDRDMHIATLRQFLRFGVIGVAATLTHIAAALVMIERLGIDIMAANAFAFCIAFPVSYFGNHAWTFRANGGHGMHVPRFLATSLGGLALNQAIVFVATRHFGLHYLTAILIVVALVPLLTFVASKLWAFAGARA